MLLLALLPLARALTCEEVGDMLAVGVPDAIVAQVIHDAGALPPGLPKCLRERGAAAELIAAAEAAPVDGSEGRPEPPPPPAELPLPRGISARDLRHPWALTRVLYQRAILPPGAHEPLIHAWLGQELLALDLPHSAGREFAQAISLGALGPVLERSWGGLVEVAERTGDDGTLRRTLRRVLPEDVPRPYRDQAWLLVGRTLLRAGSLTQALATLQEVSVRSSSARDAAFLRAAIDIRQGRLKSGVTLFRKIYEEDPSDLVGQLALVDIARVYYGLDQLERAAGLYAQIPEGSPVYAQAQLELAWAELRMDRQEDLERTLARLEEAAAGRWMPERYVVAALHATSQDHPEQAAAALAPLLALRPVAEALTGALEGSQDPDWDPRALYTGWLGPAARPPLPAALLADLRADPALAGLLSHLAVLDAEERRVRLRVGSWHAQIGSGLLISDEEDRAALEAAAGRALEGVLGARRRELADLIAQADVILAEAR